MAAVSNLPRLHDAIQSANEIMSEKGYTVAVTKVPVNPKEPVFLQLILMNGETRNIGITHLVHLTGENWDSEPFEAIAKTTDQLALSILDRVALYFQAEIKGLYINEEGMIFDLNTNIEINEDKTFSIDDTLVCYQGKPFPLSRIKSEGIIQFDKLENGHTQLYDLIDQRKEKGIFIDTTGNIYRG